ncbi:unnamed protein product [Rotaria socialis]|uniref:Cadherin domain-containing protein n=1 Tax=Rotaria socialis TaxID=392032 RepID=A0A818KEE4_9BILA|nr:unnamed protein product [Rotaria socialis]CAF4715162.1 unnamed protein product [Rotaria socialis]
MKQLNEISINEELSIGAIVTFLNDKIPHLDQSSEYDLVRPPSSDLDVFSIDNRRHTVNVKRRIDYEQICFNISSLPCRIPISIAVSIHDTIYVYILPIRILNINDNPIKFSVNRTTVEIDEHDEYWFSTAYSLPHATDADGDLITYSLYLHNWNEPTGLFELDTNNNNNLLLKPLKKFDREQQSLYLLRLRAENKDQRDVSIDVIVIIKDINDNPPRCEHNEMLFSINNFHSLSIFKLNVTDIDENDNGKLEYSLINPLPGFVIDRFNGQIIFNYTQWIRTKQSKLFINITDFGKPYRLSTQCIVEFKFTFLFDINLKVDDEKKNFISIESLDLPIGQLAIFDRQARRTCVNCSIQLQTSLNDLFYLHETTKDLYLNLNSILLIRILSNNLIRNENLPVHITIHVSDESNPLIVSTKNYSFVFNLNKEKLLKNSNLIFIKIQENIFLNEKIPLQNYFHSCLNNQTNELILIDSTNTFDIDKNNNLIARKYLNIKQQSNYELTLENNQTDEINQCSMKLRIHIYDPYSLLNAYPYFSQSFYTLTSNNISQFVLPLLPSNVKYKSSKPDDITIDEKNASITVRSSLLFLSYFYDFYIEAIDSQISSLSCSVPIRIYFGINQQSPRLSNNLTRQSIEISSSDVMYQIQAYDPDLAFDQRSNSLPPSIEYQIDSLGNLEIERYTGRIFLKNINQSTYNFTVILTDFGQPNRLITRQRIVFDVILNEEIDRQEIPMNISTTFILISACIISIVILIIIIIILSLACVQCQLSAQKSMSNLSPTTPDSCLIDNEYITTTTSLPRVVNREQRIYPTVSNDNQRTLLEQIHIPPPSLYSNEKILTKQDYHHNLSMNDINKYLERFEKIYNNSSEHHLGEPVGSVV